MRALALIDVLTQPSNETETVYSFLQVRRHLATTSDVPGHDRLHCVLRTRRE